MRRSPIIEPAKPEGGFTLLELLVSMAVLAIVVLLFAQMFLQVARFWTMVGSSKERSQNQRAIDMLIASDLRGALLPVNRANTSSLQFVVNPTGVSKTYQNPDSIFWQAPAATDQSLGDIAEVGYFVQWDQSNPSNPHARLCRFFINPGSMVNGTATADPNYLIYTNPSAWISDEIIQAVAPASAAQAYQGLFAENVLGLWVQCLDPSNNPITQDATGTAFGGRAFDSRRYTYPVTGASGRNSVAANGSSLPATVQLSLVLIDAPMAARIDPSKEAAIQNWCAQAANATAFITDAMKDPSLTSIQSGMRAIQAQIYLQASR